jgi:hypothetical protein
MYNHILLRQLTTDLSNLFNEYQTFHQRYMDIIGKKKGEQNNLVKPGDYESLYNKLTALTRKLVLKQKEIQDLTITDFGHYLAEDQKTIIMGLNDYVYNLSKSINLLSMIVEIEFLQSMNKIEIASNDFTAKWEKYHQQFEKCQLDGIKINEQYQKLYGEPIFILK